MALTVLDMDITIKNSEILNLLQLQYCISFGLTTATEINVQYTIMKTASSDTLATVGRLAAALGKLTKCVNSESCNQLSHVTDYTLFQ